MVRPTEGARINHMMMLHLSIVGEGSYERPRILVSFFIIIDILYLNMTGFEHIAPTFHTLLLHNKCLPIVTKLMNGDLGVFPTRRT